MAPDVDIDLLERAMVTAGWQSVDLLNTIGDGAAARAARHRWDTDYQHASESVRPLGPTVIDPRRARGYESRANLTRFARTLAFVRPGDRVFDIGLGYGYLAGLLLRDAQLEAYRGVDILSTYVRATDGVINALDAAERADVAVGDLYAITRDELTDRKTSLVICCEVIEHVPDPERALQVLADALPEGAELLFSVPLLTRLEGMWGHVAFFDTHRVQSMLAAAGLTAHVVEAVANTWVFVLASRDTAASTRGLAAVAAAQASFAPPSRDLPTHTQTIDLTTSPFESSARVKGMAENAISVGDSGLTCHLRAQGGDVAGIGGVRLPIAKGAQGFRFEIEPTPVDVIESIRFDAYDGDTLVARWRWRPAANPSDKQRVTAVLHGGRRGSRFVRERLGDIRSATSVEVVAELEPGATATLTLSRAALLL